MANLEAMNPMPLDQISLYEKDLHKIMCNDIEVTHYNNHGAKFDQVLVPIVRMTFEVMMFVNTQFHLGE